MIIGMGIDVVNIKRVEMLILKFPSRFLSRCFTDSEQKIFQKLSNNKKKFILKVAGFYAVKEAFVKAIGTGFRFGISFTDIEISNDNFGKPTLKLDGNAKKYLEKKYPSIEKIKYHLSISDDNPVVVAVVIMEELKWITEGQG